MTHYEKQVRDALAARVEDGDEVAEIVLASLDPEDVARSMRDGAPADFYVQKAIGAA